MNEISKSNLIKKENNPPNISSQRTINRKQIFTKKRKHESDGLGTHVVASFAEGLVAAVASNPVTEFRGGA